MLFQFNNVTKEFKTDFYKSPVKALTDLSFSVNEGELIGFLGANGAGKTTSIKILLEFIAPTRGEVHFLPALGQNFSEIKKQIGVLNERPYFSLDLTGNEYLYFMGSLHELKKTEIKNQVARLAAKLLPEEALSRPLRTYSKGMLQRIGVIASLLHNPKILIYDEPMSGLDPIGRKEIKDLMVDLHKEGKTVFFSTHIVSDVEEIAGRVLVLSQGKLCHDKTLKEMFEETLARDYLLVGKKQSGESVELRLKKENKEQGLLEFLQQGGVIHSLKQDLPTLEQIIYQTK